MAFFFAKTSHYSAYGLLCSTVKSSGLVKYSNPKINNMERIKETFCMMAKNPQWPEPYKYKVK
jgi:hypothetical protein